MEAAAPSLLLGLGLIALGYLAGSLSSAIVIAKLLRLPDPRQEGSRNPGATNILRLAGRGPAAAALVGDFLKGVAPVALAVALEAAAPVVALVGLAAFLGHLYPLYFGFEGGKGVATGLGVILAWSPLAGALALVTWVLVAALFRYSSLAAMATFVAAPAYLYLLHGAPAVSSAMLVMAALCLWRHRGNVYRLVTGTEPRLGAKGST